MKHRGVFFTSVGFCLIWNAVQHCWGFQTTTTIIGGKRELKHDRVALRHTTSMYSKSSSESEESFEIDPKFVQRNKRWVVIVDDEEPIRLAVGDYLFDKGYQVSACADADSMLELCSKPKPDGESPVPSAIISDIRMPGKDGIELLSLIRADGRLARTPVILLTAKAMTKDRIDGYKAGADVYLPKPFDPEELLSILDNVIQRRKQMTGKNGSLVELKQDMDNIKQIMKKNSVAVVKKTDVFLTDAERDVLELISKGFTNAEIAAERGVGTVGINKVIQKLYQETRTQTRTELVRWAITHGYVSARSRN
eukprot:scaffold1804_cov125-Cylindrotheca_fusiformis.AAC.2